MSRFKKLSHSVWYCNYHIVWTPKYRYRILKGEIKADIERSIHQFVEQQGGLVDELNVQIDHVHLLASVPPKVSISSFVVKVKGQTSIRIFQKYKSLKQKLYWGNHFWARGYCVDTVGLDEEMIRKYVKYQEEREPNK
ncbi:MULTISPECIES: IS200/IS605 family transposase [unclassified Carboxylicivirga]|uniref:IS200/IS605 family transposase n=1 Tax=Carboxylicivirga TaxID=1628153 RepID=UPI003D3437EA